MGDGYETVDSRLVHENHIMSIRVEQVRMPGGQIAERDVIDRMGAVVIVALDGDGRVFLLSQYRHPVGGFVVELPAGLLDKPDETPFEAARRELYEEAGLRASTWHTLLDLRLTPAAMNHRVRVYLARDLTVVPDDERYELGQGGEFEEADFRSEWVDLGEAVGRALAGELQNDAAVAGLLATAAAAAQTDDWHSLRPADLPWPPRLVTGQAPRVPSAGSAEVGPPA
ncbi:NUDIX domain-containing protein [Pseudofrankia inefficax]|uniref:NUDIX hydrolase n=1 Tax=Pseudofrankia inefficax (strain DSM 45817 / CECT 9037 / DDB 130130 / EuI1c) TaxID=298654 RepID=E3IX62_PSEI1|nr:NUDIX hydrolase [Pseudofrankia inefficax]ADP83834.1 NUDIX hydrolase [Pseudofrankia inefficax]